MLREFLTSLVIPAGRHARDLGYLYEGIAIEARYRRCRRAWLAHVERCRSVVIEAAAACPRRRLAVVLGSGSLYDVPVANLAAEFERVVLLDIVHTWRARAARRRWSNLVLLEQDLLGLAGAGRAGLETAPSRLGAWRGKLAEADLVVSPNLLTQLPLAPLLHWGEALGGERQAWAAAVMQAHLDDLAAGPGRACLISEWRRRRFDRSGREILREDPLAGLDLPAVQESWEWNIAPRGELPGGETVTLDVGAYSPRSLAVGSG